MPRNGYTIGQGLADAGRAIGGGLSRKWAEDDEKKRDKDKNVAWWEATGMDAQYPDIGKAVREGRMDRYSANNAARQRQDQDKIKADAEKAADAFQAAAKSDEAQMDIRKREEINLNASGAMRTIPPAQQQAVAANIADETEPSQQFSMREGLQKRTTDAATKQQDAIKKEAEQAAKTFFAQKELSGQATPEDRAQAFGKGIVTASQIGIGKKPGGGGSTFPTPTQQAARSKDIAYKQIEVDSHKKLPEFQQQFLATVPVEQRTFVQGGEVERGAETIRKRWVDEQQLRYLQENPLQSQEETDAVYESLQEELRSLMQELNDLKGQ